NSCHSRLLDAWQSNRSAVQHCCRLGMNVTVVKVLDTAIGPEVPARIARGANEGQGGTESSLRPFAIKSRQSPPTREQLLHRTQLHGALLCEQIIERCDERSRIHEYGGDSMLFVYDRRKGHY